MIILMNFSTNIKRVGLFSKLLGQHADLIQESRPMSNIPFNGRGGFNLVFLEWYPMSQCFF